MSRTTAVLEAAAARAAAVVERGGTRASRPSQRRAAEDAPAGGAYVTARTQMSMRDAASGDGALRFEGMASVYEPADHGAADHVCRGYQMWDMFGPYTEFVHLGAGTASLANPNLDVPFVTDHRSLQRLARTGNATSPLELAEVNDDPVSPGLSVVAPSLQRANPFVAQIEHVVQTGLVDEMSFRFMITGGSWSDDWTQYDIHAYDINRGDVSIVGYGANPHTAGSGFRGLSAYTDDELRREVEARAKRTIIDLAPRPAAPAAPSADELRRAELHRMLDLAGAAR